jgi:aspartyl-tRNA synthetase
MTTEPFRTHMVRELDDVEFGTRVRLAGWIAFKRLHSRVAFVGLRDCSGTVQVVCPPHEIVDLGRESCVAVSGVLRARPAPNDGKSVVGQVEVAEGKGRGSKPCSDAPLRDRRS